MLRVRCGFTSRREIVEADGWVVDDIDAELAADQQRARTLGLTLDVDSLRTQQGMAQAVPSEDPTTEEEPVQP